MVTIIFVLLIVTYSSLTLYKAVKSKMKGKCDYCSGCSLNGACPLQAMKTQENVPVEFSLNNK